MLSSLTWSTESVGSWGRAAGSDAAGKAVDGQQAIAVGQEDSAEDGGVVREHAPLAKKRARKSDRNALARGRVNG